MGEAIKVEMMSREMIKPSSPTPPDLKIFKLCLIDQLYPPSAYTPLLLFYSINNNTTNTISNNNRPLQLLKSSLSKYLTFFYPLAGRIKDVTSIECNDEGIAYIEANVNCSMSGLLKQPPGVEVLEQFLPDPLEANNNGAPFLFVQANLFRCGGIAIGLRISHKIADAATLCIFIKGWAAMTAFEYSMKNSWMDQSLIDSKEKQVSPITSGTCQLLSCGLVDRGPAKNFPLVIPDLATASSVLPPMDSLFSFPPPAEQVVKPSIRRLVFYGSKIDVLKANAVSSSVPNPTKVEAVIAFIWKHVTKASGFAKLSVCSNAVNLRKRIIQNSPENAIGNLSAIYFATTPSSDVEVKSLVSSLRKGLQEFSRTWLEKMQINDASNAILESLKDIGRRFQEEIRDQTYMCNFSSWCKMPLYDATDFGWGKPTWIAYPQVDASLNWGMLMDNREGDGIELWLSLKEEEMDLIEHDPEVLAFATFNPSII